MTKKRGETEPRERWSPIATVSNYADDFLAQLNIPGLPDGIPQRLEEALRARINAFLYHLREAKKEHYIRVLEIRLVREALSAVLTAYELGLSDAPVLYASFRHAVQDLGYESVDAGWVKRREGPEDGG